MTTTLQTGCRLSAVPADMVPLVWPTAHELLKEAIEMNQGTATLEDVYRQLECGEATLWVAEMHHMILAMGVTEIAQYPRGLALRIWLLAGHDIQLWLEGMSVFESVARAHGCAFMEAFTRRGMAKLLRDLGFESKYAWALKKIDARTH